MKLNTVISLATIYLILFVASVYILGEHFITGTLFLFSPLMMYWMVMRILKDNYKETRIFEKYFYADRQKQRVNFSDS